MNEKLTELLAFNALVFQTINMALTNGMGLDILTAIGAITGAVATKGADPAQDLAALQALNKIVVDLATARKNVQAAG